MKNKNLRRIIAITFFSLFVFVVSSVPISYGDNDISEELTRDKRYIYPITYDSPEWQDFDGVNEKLQACRIPEELLKEMSVEQLVDAVIDFPLLVNVVLYNSPEEGLEALSQQSDAYRELLSREGGKEAFMEKVKTFAYLEPSEDKSDLLFLQMLLDENDIRNSNTMNKVSYVKTPKGTKVEVTEPKDISKSEKDKIVRQIKKAYPKIEILRDPDGRYNCHSYAWYSTSSSNKYWMNDPSAYMSDGSYETDYILSASKNTRMYYDGGGHSAMVDIAGPVKGKEYIRVISKWGRGPLVRHYAKECPYYSLTDNLYLWRRK